MMVLTQKFAIDMAERRQGHIINIASMAGKMATAKSTVLIKFVLRRELFIKFFYFEEEFECKS
ncbi:hypothetical protein EfmAA96_13310 [Enterococcus faecium]|nr:hypothetical protein EfmAA96_13310 [Enterococcus faecium]